MSAIRRAIERRAIPGEPLDVDAIETQVRAAMARRIGSAEEAMKHCPRCGETKRTNDFGKNSSRADGLAVYCRDCRKTPM